MLRILAAVAVVVVLSGAAIAGSLELLTNDELETLSAGIAAEQSGDDAMAERLLRPIAEGGNRESQLLLGIIYDNFDGRGQGVTQDFAEAMKWYRLAAEQGLAAALYNLGRIYAFGRGVPQDYVDAVKWYRL